MNRKDVAHWRLTAHACSSCLSTHAQSVRSISVVPISHDPLNPSGGHPNPAHPAFYGYRCYYFEGDKIIMTLYRTRDGNTHLDPRPDEWPEFEDTKGWFEDPGQ